MIKNGLYSLAAVSLDGVDAEVGGVLILRDGHITGGELLCLLRRDLRMFRWQVDGRND